MEFLDGSGGVEGGGGGGRAGCLPLATAVLERLELGERLLQCYAAGKNNFVFLCKIAVSVTFSAACCRVVM